MRSRAVLLVALASGCSSALTPRDPAFGKVDAQVAWTSGVASGEADIGRLVGVAERGSDVLVVGERGARFYRDGVLVATDTSSRESLAAAAAMPASDGRGTWLVAVSSSGALLRARDMNTLEPVSSRYGLTGARLRGSAMSGVGAVFLLEGGIAIAHEGTLARYDAQSAEGVRAGGQVLATWSGTGVTRYELAPDAPAKTFSTAQTYALSGVRDVAVSELGRVYVARHDGVYAEQDEKRLQLVYRPDHGVRALAASGARIWVLDGPRVVALEASGTADTVKVEVLSNVEVPESARLAGSPSGDVWILDASTAMRMSLGRERARTTTPDLQATWQRDVAPLFARVCGSCHSPGGPTGIDLSTAHAWITHRAEIQKRVVVERDMPPRGVAKAFPTDAERAKIAKWLE